MPEQQLREAFELMKQGEKNQAMMIVRGILRENRQNVDAWWLMANLLEDEDKILKCLNQILELNPEHRGARKKLESLRPDLAENLAPLDDEKMKKNQYDWSKLVAREVPTQQNTGRSFILRMVSIVVVITIFTVGPLLFSAIKDNIPVNVEGPSPVEVAQTQLTAAFNGDLDTALSLTCDSLKDEWRKMSNQLQSQAASVGLSKFEFDFSKTVFEVTEQKPQRTIIHLSGEVIIRAGGQENSFTYDDLMKMGDAPNADPNVILIVSNNHWVVCST